MDLFDRAKEMLDSMGAKTEEFVYDQKCNVKIARICAGLKKEYENLGRLCYRKVKGLVVDDNEFDALIDNIAEMKAELNRLRDSKETGDYSTTFVVEEDDEENKEDTAE